MKNKVDVRKLIKKKYSDNTLELPDLLEEIDLVLNEMKYNYTSKLNTANLEENPQDPGNARDIANRKNGNIIDPTNPSVGAPRNPISTTINGDIPGKLNVSVPDKLAEADEETNKESKQYTVQVPDIFSLITNSQNIDPNSDDSKLIQKIVRNIGAEKGYWALRIQKINEYTQTAQQPVQTKDIRKAISALIFLNLLKKLSFFVAQPGKLFEYVLRPLIGTEARVLGSVDQQIVDVTKESQGQVWDYSLKMFTGKESSFTVKGSKANLQEAVLKRGRPITYIISVSNKNNYSLEFSECLITTIPEHLPSGEWTPIKIVPDAGIVLVKDASVGVLVQTEENTEKLSSYGQVKAAEKPELYGPKAPKQPTVKVGTINYTVEKVNEELQILKPNLEFFKKIPDDTKLSYLTPVRAGTAMTKEESDFISGLDKILSILRTSTVPLNGQAIRLYTIPNVGKLYDTKQGVLASIVKIQQPNKKLEAINDVLEKAEAHEKALEKAQQQFSSVQPQQPQQTELQEADETTDKKDKTHFSIGLKNVWQIIPNKIGLNLGNPEEYNKQQLTIATDIAENMSKALEAFQELSINLVNFFGASKKEAKGGDFGNKAIENAKTISTNVAAFQAEENKEDQNKPPETK